MREFLALIIPVWLGVNGASAQQLTAPVLLPDSINTGYDLLWEGVEDSTYFVQGSWDLADWRYFNVMDQGDPAGHRFWFFSDSPSLFVRVLFTDAPTFPWDDPDLDHLTNAFELEYSLALGIDPFNPDSDGDEIEDGDEDPDADGLTNLLEQKLGLNPSLADSDGDGTTDGYEDSDQDGLLNHVEITGETDPANPDTDGDGILDGDDSNPTDPFVTGVVLAACQVLTPLQP